MLGLSGEDMEIMMEIRDPRHDPRVVCCARMCARSQCLVLRSASGCEAIEVFQRLLK